MKLKSVVNFLKWALIFRKKNFPIQYFNNENYIDWFINWRPQLKKFKNIHEGEDCFIIGNGPSLNKTNLSLLNDYYIFGLNKINMIFDRHPLNLSYHVAINQLVIEQINESLKKNVYKCPSFLSYQNSKHLTYDKNQIFKLDTSGSWTFHESIEDTIHEGYTVTFVAMQIAFYMGFKNVFLVGVDHNYKQTGNPNELQKLNGDDINHFDPNYFKGMQWHLADLLGNEASYALAKHKFYNRERNIYDATVDGKLTIFEKISFEESLSLAKKKKYNLK
jgi:hypothetical protein